jgi:uncharacterized phiE125 gp8 family phage protein
MYDRLIRGSLALATAPVEEPLALEDAKHHLRVTWDDENERIEALIQAAREHIDGRDGWVGRALITQTWDYTLREFPVEDCIRLQLPPVQSIVSVKYRDVAGNLVTFGSTNYTLSSDHDWQPEVRLAYGASWPATRDDLDAVVIQTVNGYGLTAETVPQPIRQALLLLIGHFYQNREPVNIGNITTPLPYAVEALLQPYVITAF